MHRVMLTAVAFMIAAIALAGSALADGHGEHSNYNKVYRNVTQERLNSPEAQNWLMYRRTYDSQGYSPLKQITRRNARRLVPVWTFSTGMREAHQAPPVVNDGYMFITTPHNHLIALDASTGEQIWRYARKHGRADLALRA